MPSFIKSSEASSLNFDNTLNINNPSKQIEAINKLSIHQVNPLSSLSIPENMETHFNLESSAPNKLEGANGFIDSGVLQQIDSDKLNNTFDAKVVEVLLNTPFMKHKLNQCEALSHNELTQLYQLGDQLQVKLALGTGLTSLQMTADASIGYHIDLSNVSAVHNILNKKLNAMNDKLFFATPEERQVLKGITNQLTLCQNKVARLEEKLREVKADMSWPASRDLALNHQLKNLEFQRDKAIKQGYTHRHLEQEIDGIKQERQALSTFVDFSAQQADFLMLKNELADIKMFKDNHDSVPDLQVKRLLFKHQASIDNISEILQSKIDGLSLTLTSAYNEYERVKSNIDVSASMAMFKQGFNKQEYDKLVKSLLQENQAIQQLNARRATIDNQLITQLERVAPALNVMQQALNGVNGESDPVLGLAKVYEALEAVIQVMPKGYERDTLVMLHANIKGACLTKIQQKMEAKLAQELAMLEKGGASFTFDMTFALGAEAAILGLELGSAGIEANFQCNVTGNDDTKIRQGGAFSAKLTLTGGNKVLKSDVSASGGISYGQGKTFNSLKDFISYHANDLLSVALTSEKIVDVKQAQEVGDFFSRARQSSFALRERLISDDTLLMGDHFDVGSSAAIDYLKTNVKGAGLEAGMELNLFSGSVGMSSTKTDFHHSVALLKAYQAHPERIDSNSKQFFSINFQGEELLKKAGYEKLNAVEKQLQEIQTKLAKASQPEEMKLRSQTHLLRDQVKEAMISLFNEYEHYTYVVNRLDFAKTVDDPNKKGMTSIKHGLEKQRGSTGRGEYLKAVITTHAKLKQLYLQTFMGKESVILHDANYHRLLERIDSNYDQPQMSLETKKHINKHLVTVFKASSNTAQKDASISLSVPGPKLLPISVTGAVKSCEISGDANPDNDGKYMNISFNLDQNVALFDIINGLQEKYVKQDDITDSLSKLLTVDWAAMDVTLTGSMKVEANFIEESDKYHLQYLRVSGAEVNEFSLPNLSIPVMPLNNFSLQMSASQGVSKNVFEYIGNNTLTYVQTKFNGWKCADQADKWQQFTLNNRQQLAELILNMSNDTLNAGSSLNTMLADLKAVSDPNEHAAFVAKIHGALMAVKQAPEDTNKLDHGINMLTELLSRSFPLYEQEVTARFHPQ
ncbi:hypothetical protein [uncultured Shewanella sp.]|uniref:hypothetical protein n=1 Tax=uncultured Shewanella sp. TaxID=173975 RepID=UPI0026172C8F|nr:hypothetical protein [uncultured Shewanella sp.]